MHLAQKDRHPALEERKVKLQEDRLALEARCRAGDREQLLQQLWKMFEDEEKKLTSLTEKSTVV